MRVAIKPLMANQEVLGGSEEGKRLMSRLLVEVIEPARPEPLFIDFAGILVATASFLREGPLAYRHHLRAKGSMLYPVIANAGEKVLDDLRLLLDARNDAIFACSLSRRNSVTNVQLLGRLDDKQATALRLVSELREADTATLIRHGDDDSVKATAWNNRLAALVQKGLVMETIHGRAKRFRLPVEA
jgi:hypothetical protein